jgi:hypothetical protein
MGKRSFVERELQKCMVRDGSFSLWLHRRARYGGRKGRRARRYLRILSVWRQDERWLKKWA